MTIYRVECPVTIVLINHWRDQWVIPANAGIQVPQYFLQYAQTLPLHNTRTEDHEPLPKRPRLIEQKLVRQSFHRVDLIMPSGLFDQVCIWLHGGKNFELNECKTSARFLALIVTPWNVPVPAFHPLESEMIQVHNNIVEQWNGMESANRGNSYRIELPSCTHVLNQRRLKGERWNIKCLSPLSSFGRAHTFIGGGSIYAAATTILHNRQKILNSSVIWFRQNRTIPTEVQSIAQMIALTKQIDADEALAHCVQVPFDPNAPFWDDIETHIGQTSWRVLQQLHLYGRLDLKSPTFDDFLDELPQKLDGPSRSTVNKLFEWAECVDKPTKPLEQTDDESQETESAAFME